MKELPHCPFLDKSFDISEVEQGMKKLKMGKSGGLDGMTNEILCCTPLEVTHLFTLSFSILLKCSHYPVQWATGVLLPLHKSGELDDPNNYRGITLNSSISKLFTLLLNNRLNAFCDEYELLTYNQIGFRKGFRTADHVLTLKTLIDQSFSNKKKLYACFVDFRKAYDTVWRDGLFLKLTREGVSQQFTKLIQDMYSRLQICVSLQGGLSLPFQSRVGLKQGCNLSPTLFNIFINDLPVNIDMGDVDAPLLNNINVSSLLYADDLIILSESKQGLQNSLDILNNFTKKWFLEVNTSKTKCLVFSKGRKSSEDCNFLLGNKLLEMCDSYCYLGTVFTRSGSFKTASQALNDKALGAMFSLLRNVYKHKSVSIKTMLELFDKMIVPIALYNSEVWGASLVPTNANREKNKDSFLNISHLSKLTPEILHFRFLKHLLCLPKSTTNWAALSETGRYPITLRVYQFMIKYLSHVNNTTSPILQAVYAVSVQLASKGYNSWFYSVSNLLKLMNHENFLTLPQCDMFSGALSVKKSLQEKYDDVWKVERQAQSQKGKLDLYASLKETPGIAIHLDKSSVNKYRVALTMMRTSSHKFPIEVGRYQKITRNNRLCPFGCNILGNETHYMFECRHPLIERIYLPIVNETEMFNPRFKCMTIKEKCKYLLSNNDPKIINLAGKLCFKLHEMYKMLTF